MGTTWIHPDPTMTFGFDKGRRFLIQDEFADTRDLVEGKPAKLLTEVHDGRYAERTSCGGIHRAQGNDRRG